MKKTIYSEKHARLCELLKKGRAKVGLTQQELAKKIGKPQSFIAKYEGGERRLDIVELLEIAKTLNIDLKTLIAAVS